MKSSLKPKLDSFVPPDKGDAIDKTPIPANLEFFGYPSIQFQDKSAVVFGKQLIIYSILLCIATYIAIKFQAVTGFIVFFAAAIASFVSLVTTPRTVVIERAEGEFDKYELPRLIKKPRIDGFSIDLIGYRPNASLNGKTILLIQSKFGTIDQDFAATRTQFRLWKDPHLDEELFRSIAPYFLFHAMRQPDNL